MNDKVEAVYALRHAAEAHGRAEAQLDIENSPENRDVVLDTKVELEAKTAEAIESCQYCGRSHQDDHPHKRASVTHTPEGIIELRFAPRADDVPKKDAEPPA